MKKTIWLPLVFGLGFGILAGISLAANIAYADASGYSAGIYPIFFLLAFALGGPLSALITVTVTVAIAALWGYPALKDLFMTYPSFMIINLLANAIAGIVSGLAYRFVYQRIKMPVRLLPWAGIVLLHYVIAVWITGEGARALIPDVQLVSGFFETLRISILEMVAVFLITSLIWIALPEHYRRPLWYELKPAEGKG